MVYRWGMDGWSDNTRCAFLLSGSKVTGSGVALGHPLAGGVTELVCKAVLLNKLSYLGKMVAVSTTHTIIREYML